MVKQYQIRVGGDSFWTDLDMEETFMFSGEIRVKPVPREWTIVLYSDGSKEVFDKFKGYLGNELVHVREVIEE